MTATIAYRIAVPPGLLFGGLKYAGSKLQPLMGAPLEVINITIGVIVFFIADAKIDQTY